MIDVKHWMPYRVMDRDANYLYAIRHENDTSSLYRLASYDDEPAAPIKVWPGGWMRSLWCSPDYPGTMLARIHQGIYKSVDGGLNWGNNAPNFDNGSAIFILGAIGEPALANTGVLQEGVCWDGDNVYLCEYNVNTVREDGGINDAVKVLKSTDRGTTWSLAASWNTDGNHYVRHMHGIQKHGAYLYLLFGDYDYESGILRWDPTQPLASNQPLTAYTNCWTGAQRYRTGGIVFPPGDFMYWTADSSGGGTTGTERGIWKGRKDMTGTPVRVDNKMAEFSRHSGWTGCLLQNGDMVFGEFLEVEAAGDPIYLYGTHDGGATWERCGTWGANLDGRGGAENFFTWKDGLTYFCKVAHSGKASDNGTVVLKPKAYSAQEGSRIVHPVYWVARSGQDTDDNFRGQLPSRPWRSIEHALTGNRVTYGARVIVGAGRYEASPITPQWTANPKPPKAVAPVLVEGAPSESTAIALDGGGSLTDLIAASPSMPFSLRSLRLIAGSVSGLTVGRSGPAVMSGSKV